MNNLDPCPFCGSEDVAIHEEARDGRKDRVATYVACNNCFAQGPPSVMMIYAKAGWNHKVGAGASPDILAACQAMLPCLESFVALHPGQCD